MAFTAETIVLSSGSLCGPGSDAASDCELDDLDDLDMGLDRDPSPAQLVREVLDLCSPAGTTFSTRNSRPLRKDAASVDLSRTRADAWDSDDEEIPLPPSSQMRPFALRNSLGTYPAQGLRADSNDQDEDTAALDQQEHEDDKEAVDESEEELSVLHFRDHLAGFSGPAEQEAGHGFARAHTTTTTTTTTTAPPQRKQSLARRTRSEPTTAGKGEAVSAGSTRKRKALVETHRQSQGSQSEAEAGADVEADVEVKSKPKSKRKAAAASRVKAPPKPKSAPKATSTSKPTSKAKAKGKSKAKAKADEQTTTGPSGGDENVPPPSTPMPTPSPLDLASIPSAHCNILTMCPFCGARFAPSKSGPLRRKHLAACGAVRCARVLGPRTGGTSLPSSPRGGASARSSPNLSPNSSSSSQALRSGFRPSQPLTSSQARSQRRRALTDMAHSVIRSEVERLDRAERLAQQAEEEAKSAWHVVLERSGLEVREEERREEEEMWAAFGVPVARFRARDEAGGSAGKRKVRDKDRGKHRDAMSLGEAKAKPKAKRRKLPGDRGSLLKPPCEVRAAVCRKMEEVLGPPCQPQPQPQLQLQLPPQLEPAATPYRSRLAERRRLRVRARIGLGCGGGELLQLSAEGFSTAEGAG